MAHILLIEDNMDFIEFVRAVLELNGHTVMHTRTWHHSTGLDFLTQVASPVTMVAMTASTDADLGDNARDLLKMVNAALREG